MAFAGMGRGGTAIDLENPITNTTEEKTPLIQKLLAVPEYKARYLEIVAEYVGILEDFEATVTEKAAQIRPYVEADPSKFTTIEVFDAVTSYQEVQMVTFDTETSATMTLQNGQIPQDGQMPQDGQIPNGEFPQNGMRPTQGEVPAGGERPQNGERPDKSGFPTVGERTENGVQGGNQGFGDNMKGGMSLEGSSTSLVNLMRAQVLRIQEALETLLNP